MEYAEELTMYTCYECGGTESTQQTVSIPTKVGTHVMLDHVVRPVCLKCGAFTIPAEMADKIEQRAALALSNVQNPGEETLRFIRSVLS